jgi:asparagine synthase (glutamine-hydrolysing)
MCGICGFTGKGNLELLKHMTKLLSHRGPDDEGYYRRDRVNLGVRRLAIIDLKKGAQPQTNETESIWVIFNGEIYNYLDLRNQLLKQGHVFKSHHSDTEVIVHLYEQYGLDFINKINGMFAIAIWDTEKEVLILIRDRLGVKPLYYTVVNGELIFSSEIKSILAHPLIKKEPDFKSLYYYLSLKNIPSPYTAFKKISALRPGNYLIFKDGETTIKRYWDLGFSSNFIKEDEAIDRMYEILKDAVRIRLRSDVEIGCYLSGGLDSSIVVAMASKLSNLRLKTFSLGYKENIPSKDKDISSARLISKLYNTQHFEYLTDSKELIDEISNIVSSFDQPFGGVISTYFLTKLVSRHVKVALSGDGADELFGSYLSHRIASCYDNYKTYLKTGKINGNLVLFKGQMKFIKELFDKSCKIYEWRAKILPFSKINSKKIFCKDVQDIIATENLEDYLREFFNSKPDETLNKVLEAEIKTLFPDQVLAFVDFLSMAHSVEIRSPFIDYRFVELVAQLPQELKIKDGTVKYILKKFAMAKNLLPEEVINRPKEGFVMPIYKWMDGELKECIQDILSISSLRDLKIFEPLYIKSILNLHYHKNVKLYAEIWNIVMLVLWYRKYFS